MPSSQPPALEDNRRRTACVTGGAGGIGSAIAHRLARENIHVIIADIASDGAERVAQAIRESGGSASSYELDASSRDDIARMLDHVEKRFDPVSLLVTCAGICPVTPFLDLTLSTWDRTMDINLKGTFLAMQEVSRRLVAAKMPGSIVGISSVSARGGRADTVDYAVSKAGVITLVRSVALALAASDITVNAVCPGLVLTDMTQSIHTERALVAGTSTADSMAKFAAAIPLQRVAEASEIASAVAFLLSSDARYITGQAINVDGGLEFS